MAGSYNHFKHTYRDKTIDRTILAADDSTDHANVIEPKNSSYTIYVQKIALAITTHADQTITFQDGAGTPVIIAAHTDEATAGTSRPHDIPGTIIWDFGPEGTPLTQGEELDITFSAAGIAGRCHIEAYEKLTAPVAAASTN